MSSDRIGIVTTDDNSTAPIIARLERAITALNLGTEADLQSAADLCSWAYCRIRDLARHRRQEAKTQAGRWPPK